MTQIKRRQLLQFAGSLLTGLGLSQLDIQRQAIRYGQVIAQSHPRKLALLVGINQYQAPIYPPLQGCITDVELQRELLVYRFGFHPSDILTLTDAAATRSNILTAFEEHLIKQAKPGDVVVFHYSGHGSQVVDPEPIAPDGLNSTFVPVDVPQRLQEGIVEDIMGRTLFLLMSALNTENVTAVLDSCHSGGGTRGNFRIRAVRADVGKFLQGSPEEFAYQERWRYELQMSLARFNQQRRAGVAKGVVIASAQRQQQALDAPFSDFYAGAFTYLMTQYLWQETATVLQLVATVSREIKNFSPQVPLADIQPNSGAENQAIYFSQTPQPFAEAVIVQVDGETVKLWLGGIDMQTIEAFDQGATFTIISPDSSGEVELISRAGLTAQGTLKGTAKPGALLQESARAIPADLKLRIGLDPSLAGDIDVAQKSLETIARIAAVPPQPGNIPYSGEVHYLLSRFTLGDATNLATAAQLPEIDSIGLFSPGKDEIIPDSFGSASETISLAIYRLNPKLKSLLAARIVKMTLNAQASRINVAASMFPEGQGAKLIGQAFTPRSRSQTPTAPQLPATNQLPVNTPFQFQLTNNETRPLYVSILVIDPSGQIIVLFPNRWGAASDASRVEAGQTIFIPNVETDDFTFVTQSKGIGEALIIASQNPLRNALLTLQKLAAEQQVQRGAVVPDVDAIGALLDDLSRSDRGAGGIVGVRQRLRATEIAALSISFEVI
ncbi:MAG TPA: caspase family protein [Oscillatoriaceae cyanobacterium M33_DOE_052]|uniref:DUF4384 domain-containing protein n=1 Tax=Planktothricoides sp. SpSt-374 TaxID=2282167 RepID=A0A7C3VQB5_9CYAN|nr:caspase family protein [Oscillatoriaceae cyanobacterium M33_DOE_052]